MKKYLGFLVVLSILTFGGIKVEATNDIGCNGGTMYSPTTGQVCSNYNNGCTAGALYSVTTGQHCLGSLPPIDQIRPSITLLSPNGGESCNAGQQIEIRWKTENISSEIAEINLNSINGWGGGVGVTLGKQFKNDGYEIVTFPNVSDFMGANSPFGKYFTVEIVAVDNYGVIRRDSSNDTFTIKNGVENNNPSITVLSPNGGEVYNLTDTFRPTWTYNYVPLSYDDTVVSIIDLGNSAEYFVGRGESGFGTTINHTPAIAQAVSLGKKNFKLKVTNNGVTDKSDNTFIINSGFENNNPSINVLSPNGGEEFKLGDQIRVSWDSRNIPLNANLDVRLSYRNGANGGTVYQKNVSGNTNNTTLIVPNDLTFFKSNLMKFGNFYKVIIKDMNSGIKDESDHYLTINEDGNSYECNSNSQPSVTILSPNGGENYNSFDQDDIRWRTCNIGSNPETQLDIMDDRIPGHIASSLFGTVLVLNYANLVSSEGNEKTYSYAFKIPKNFDDSLPVKYKGIFGGNHYKANVTVLLSGKAGTQTQEVTSDASDNSFILNSVDNNRNGSITVLSPNGEEVYQAGQQVVVKWNSVGIPKTDYIQINLQNVVDNKEYQVGIIKTLNDGEEIFTLPKTDWDGTKIVGGQKYKIGLWTVKGEGFPTYVDYSDNLFSIAEYSIDPVENSLSSNYGVIKKGTVSNEVKTVQSALTKQGYTLTADGKFGPKTEEAVKRFQAMKGLPVTGVIDDTTMSMILSYILGL